MKYINVSLIAFVTVSFVLSPVVVGATVTQQQKDDLYNTVITKGNQLKTDGVTLSAATKQKIVSAIERIFNEIDAAIATIYQAADDLQDIIDKVAITGFDTSEVQVALDQAVVDTNAAAADIEAIESLVEDALNGQSVSKSEIQALFQSVVASVTAAAESIEEVINLVESYQ